MMRCSKQTAVVYFQMFHLRDLLFFFLGSSASLHCGHDDLKPVEEVSFPPLTKPVFLIEMNMHDGKNGFQVLPPCGGCCHSSSPSSSGGKASGMDSHSSIC